MTNIFLSLLIQKYQLLQIETGEAVIYSFAHISLQKNTSC